MNRFVKKSFLFILLVVVIDVLFGKIMSSILSSTSKGDWGRRNYIITETTEDVLIFGSSRSIHHYDPQILSDSLHMSCYNCGEDGNGILSHFPRIEMILHRYTPHIIIYDLMPKYDFKICDNTSFLKILRPYSDDSLVKEIIHDIDEKENLKLYSNLYKYNSSFIEIMTHRFSRVTTTAKKYTYSPLVSVMDYEPGGEDKYKDDNIDLVKYHYLVELVDLCHSHGIKLFFTASPWYKMNESDVFGPILKLCEEKGVVFLNHNFDERFNYDRSYFHDVPHLNKYGAETFSSLIAHEIKENL